MAGGGYGVTDDDPITLADACGIFRGKITAATLRKEATRGNLAIFRVGRRVFTTAASVREMILKCRVAAPPPDSILTGRDNSGSFATEQLTAAQAALRQSLAKRSGRSLTTLEASMSRPHQRRRQSLTS